ncbi:MAG: 23S rRNA (uracil1939-C5)-methyltransferase [Phenylobacterium sp.]|jgi:23S rRNA (uracil1939-C5)-methyltransferase
MAQFFKAKKKTQTSQRQLKLTIEQFNHDGQGIGYSNDKICFVEGALPGEVVQAKIVEDKAKFIKAQCTKIITPSEQRITPQCVHFNQCGGCQLQYVNEDSQLELKREAVNRLFGRFANVDSLPWQDSLRAKSWHYRRSARIGVWYERKTGEFTVGFRRRNAKQLTPIDQCPVVVDAFADLFSAFAELLPRLKAGRAVTHLEVCQADNANVVIIRHTQPLTKQDVAKIAQLGQTSGYLILSEAEKGQFTCLTATVIPPLYYQLPQFNCKLEFNIGDFIQINAGINEQMVAQAIDWLDIKPDDNVLDLFCGIGNFSLPLASKCANVVGIEGVDKMVEQASHNVRLNGLTNASFYQADLSQDKALDIGYKTFDKILLDPARAGADGVISTLKGYKASKIVYVSCEPLTLARDSFVLLKSGYRLSKIALMDMFSQTRHVEVMALFVKSS